MNRIIVFVAGLLLAVSAFVKTYHRRVDADGNLLWNPTEAYLFINVGSRGYYISYLQYPVQVIKEYFGDVPLPTAERFSVLVFHITRDAVEKNVAENILPDLYTPLGRTVYVNVQGRLWEWSGSSFAPASVETVQKVGGIFSLSADDITQPTGWSKRGGVLSRLEDEVEFPMEIGGKILTVVVKRHKSDGDAISVDVLGIGQGREELWQTGRRPERISRLEYKRLFE